MKTTDRKKELVKTDLPESENDKRQLQPDEGILDLPDVKDIPGQEHIRPLIGGELADTTISSADEEGGKLFDTDEESLTDNEANVSKLERDLLQRSSESMSTLEDEQLNSALPDNTDEDGELLNEKMNRSGTELDVPGSEEDDANEKIGEEDEENNSYSIRDPEDE